MKNSSKAFKHDHGNLWKCTYPQIGPTSATTRIVQIHPSWNGEQRVYELKTNETADDYSAIRDLCHTVERRDAEFQCA